MATNRSVDSRFWRDGWIRKINPLDRYVFLYFLTNEHSTWCGVYELPLDVAAFETGMKEEEIVTSILPKLSPKVIYLDGWVYIPNWNKYHLSESGSVSPQQQKGIESAWNKVPERIRLKIKEIEGNTIPYTYPIGGVSPFTSTFTSTSTSTFINAPPEGDIDNLINEKGAITHDYQFIGLEVFEKTGAPLNKKSECIRLARDYPKYVHQSLSFCLDYPNPALKWKMFLWKLNQLKKDDKKS